MTDQVIHKMGKKLGPDPNASLFPRAIPEIKPIPEEDIEYQYLFSPIENQANAGACFPKGTLVQMADGSFKEIEKISVLDKVISAEGNICLVEATMARRYQRNMYHIAVKGNNLLKCTDKHQILTKRGYVKAKELRTDDWVYVPKVCTGKINLFLDVTKIISEQEYKKFSSRRSKFIRKLRGGADLNLSTQVIGIIEIKAINPPKMIELTEDFGELLGIYLAEGNADKHKVCFSFNSNEEATLVKRTVDLCKMLLGVDSHVRIKPKNNTAIVTIHGIPWVRFFSRLCGTGSKNKKLHKLLSQGNLSFLRGILQGWLFGDGNLKDNQVTGVTISHHLALQMYRIANLLGFMPNVRKSIPAPNKYAKVRQPRYDVTFAQEYKATSASLGRGKQNKRHQICKVRSIMTEHFNGFIFNIKVAKDYSYIAEGIGVHV